MTVAASYQAQTEQHGNVEANQLQDTLTVHTDLTTVQASNLTPGIRDKLHKHSGFNMNSNNANYPPDANETDDADRPCFFVELHRVRIWIGRLMMAGTAFLDGIARSVAQEDSVREVPVQVVNLQSPSHDTSDFTDEINPLRRQAATLDIAADIAGGESEDGILRSRSTPTGSGNYGLPIQSDGGTANTTANTSE